MNIVSPYRSAVAVTTSDVTVLPKTRAVYVGGAGNMVVRIGGSTVTFSGIPAGTLLPIEVDQIQATLTTATLIVALY